MERIKLPPYKCPVCGLSDVNEEYHFCDFCGWTADSYQDADPDMWGGVSILSVNEYKSIWEVYKQEIVNYEGLKSELIEKLFEQKHPNVITGRK